MKSTPPPPKALVSYNEVIRTQKLTRALLRGVLEKLGIQPETVGTGPRPRHFIRASEIPRIAAFVNGK